MATLDRAPWGYFLTDSVDSADSVGYGYVMFGDEDMLEGGGEC